MVPASERHGSYENAIFAAGLFITAMRLYGRWYQGRMKKDALVTKHLWKVWGALPFADASKTVKMMQESLNEQLYWGNCNSSLSISHFSFFTGPTCTAGKEEADV